MVYLSEQVNAMGPLIDQELERVDRKHAQLTQLSSDLVEALNLYHTLMREPVTPQSYHTVPKQVNYGYPPPPSGHVSDVLYLHVFGKFSYEEHRNCFHVI
jgi:signal transducing adaptor molecule